MSSIKYLSKKKKAKLSISTSDQLKNWIITHANQMKKENPADQRYKSTSSFVHDILEQVMDLYKKGKTLDEIKEAPDEEVLDFYDSLTYKALIPQIEELIQYSRYIVPSKRLMELFFGYRNFFIKDFNYDDTTNESMYNLMERFRNFVVSNNVSRSLDVYRDGKFHVIEYTGRHNNIHYENSKALAAIMGIVGLKLEDIELMKLYARFNLEETSLLRDRKLKLKERRQLAYQNLEKFISNEQMIDDKTHHVWLNSSNDMNAIVSFRDVEAGLKFIKSKTKDLPAKDLYGKILKLLEHFHWIKINEDDESSFQNLLPKEGHDIEYKIIEKVIHDYVS